MKIAFTVCIIIMCILLGCSKEITDRPMQNNDENKESVTSPRLEINLSENNILDISDHSTDISVFEVRGISKISSSFLNVYFPKSERDVISDERRDGHYLYHCIGKNNKTCWLEQFTSTEGDVISSSFYFSTDNARYINSVFILPDLESMWLSLSTVTDFEKNEDLDFMSIDEAQTILLDVISLLDIRDEVVSIETYSLRKTELQSTANRLLEEGRLSPPEPTINFTPKQTEDMYKQFTKDDECYYFVIYFGFNGTPFVSPLLYPTLTPYGEAIISKNGLEYLRLTSPNEIVTPLYSVSTISYNSALDIINSSYFKPNDVVEYCIEDLELQYYAIRDTIKDPIKYIPVWCASILEQYNEKLYHRTRYDTILINAETGEVINN